MSDAPRSWHLSDFEGLSKEPDHVDPQTGGRLWKIWNLGATAEMLALYAVVHPGNRTGAHTHPDANHYTAVVKGTALVWIEGTMVTLGPGDVINIPVNALHDFGADPSGDCWVIDITSPPFDPEKMAFDPSREDEIAKAFAEAMG
jgi:quercetin dioxygenase-like cupin family protein